MVDNAGPQADKVVIPHMAGHFRCLCRMFNQRDISSHQHGSRSSSKPKNTRTPVTC